MYACVCVRVCASVAPACVCCRYLLTSAACSMAIGYFLLCVCVYFIYAHICLYVNMTEYE